MDDKEAQEWIKLQALTANLAEINSGMADRYLSERDEARRQLANESIRLSEARAKIGRQAEQITKLEMAKTGLRSSLSGAQRDLAEARKIAGGLLRFARQIMLAHTHIPGRTRAYIWHADARDAYEALPR
jgi:hypothetical protein